MRTRFPLRCYVEGVGAHARQHTSNALFSERRRKILEDLQANKNDKSHAGCIDPRVYPLVCFINQSFSCYVTSSSCSGRVSLFHKGQLSHSSADIAGSVGPQSRKRGAFGRGPLFQSHDPLLDVEAVVEQQLVPALKGFDDWRRQLPDSLQLEKERSQTGLFDFRLYETELLELKFEPMIIHIQCETIEDAARLLQCAGESGQMESGILSCSRGAMDQRKITCCITSSLRIALPLFAQGRWLLADSCFSSADWQALLKNTITHINVLFEINERRRERFAEEVKKRLL
uniref:tRNA(Phe) 7-[(3-amino-3-carboxypropyl)-4-demethylwyosine(37)-N(4)]-methyltransferase n=1 Tax=Trypanosoma congolense (strain IL3000) TaxID=1068625 RepID=G0V399_TRYCI|nr:unnamed protein product [Trypanosoma congolense IL3000]